MFARSKIRCYGSRQTLKRNSTTSSPSIEAVFNRRTAAVTCTESQFSQGYSSIRPWSRLIPGLEPAVNALPLELNHRPTEACAATRVRHVRAAPADSALRPTEVASLTSRPSQPQTIAPRLFALPRNQPPTAHNGCLPLLAFSHGDTYDGAHPRRHPSDLHRHLRERSRPRCVVHPVREPSQSRGHLLEGKEDVSHDPT